MAKIRMIFNPEAEWRSADQAAGKLRQFADEWTGADWVGSDCPGRSCEPAAPAKAGPVTDIALRGDGIVHKVVNGIMTVDPVRKPRLSIDIDGRKQAGRFLMLALGNGTREGGEFRTTPDAALDDGRLDFVPVESVSLLPMLRRIPEFMRGTRARFPEVHLGRFRRLTVHSDMAFPIQTDGEMLASYAADVRGVTVEVVPAALKVII
jgi:diacylglycerol kinase family enzyme